MVKHNQIICRLLPTNCLNVFDHFVGLAFKELSLTNSCSAGISNTAIFVIAQTFPLMANIHCFKLKFILNMLSLPAPCISESCIQTKINLNFYFHTYLWYLKRFYEGLKGLHKTFSGTTKKFERKNFSKFFLFVRDLGGKG